MLGLLWDRTVSLAPATALGDGRIRGGSWSYERRGGSVTCDRGVECAVLACGWLHHRPRVAMSGLLTEFLELQAFCFSTC